MVNYVVLPVIRILAMAMMIGPMNVRMINAAVIEASQYGHCVRSDVRRRMRTSGTAPVTIDTATTPDHRRGMCDVAAPGSAHAMRVAIESKNPANKYKRIKGNV